MNTPLHMPIISYSKYASQCTFVYSNVQVC